LLKAPSGALNGSVRLTFPIIFALAAQKKSMRFAVTFHIKKISKISLLTSDAHEGIKKHPACSIARRNT
jgi:hypothetical protein